MTQSTMTKPATSSTYNPYSDMDADKKKSDAATADSVSAEPVYKLVIDENVVEKISSMAAQSIDGIIDMKGNVLSLPHPGRPGRRRQDKGRGRRYRRRHEREDQPRRDHGVRQVRP